MLTFPTKLHVVSRSDEQLRVATFSRDSALTLTDTRMLSPDLPFTEQLRDLGGGLVLYAISQEECSRKRLDFATDFRFDTDPEQICWEIERRSILPFHKFRYSLLSLKGAENRNSLAVFAISDEKQIEIGQLFHSTNLLLHRLIFKPVALHNALRTKIGVEQTVAIIVSRGQVDLLYYDQQRLFELRSLKCDLGEEREAAQFVDDVGTLAASVFKGVRLNQRLSLLVAGTGEPKSLLERFSTQLPYRIESHYCAITEVCNVGEIHSGVNPESQFDLAIIANAFAESEPCESLPVKNAASP